MVRQRVAGRVGVSSTLRCLSELGQAAHFPRPQPVRAMTAEQICSRFRRLAQGPFDLRDLRTISWPGRRSKAATRAAFSVASTKASQAAACVVCMRSRVSGVNHESKTFDSAAICDRSKKRSPFSSSRAGKSSSDARPGKPIVVAAPAARPNSERCIGKPTICRRYGCADLAAACAMLPSCLTSSSTAEFFRGQPWESATKGGAPPFRPERRHSKAVRVLRIISNQMNGNRLNGRSGKSQH